MYKGKRRRLRKKDLNEQTTIEVKWSDLYLGKYKIWVSGTKRKFFSKKSDGVLNKNMVVGDKLSLIVNMSVYHRGNGLPVFEARPFVLLPDVEGRKYYWVDEEQA